MQKATLIDKKFRLIAKLKDESKIDKILHSIYLYYIIMKLHIIKLIHRLPQLREGRLVPEERLELPTSRLQGECSTN